MLFRFRINCQFSFHSRSKLPTTLQGSSPSTSSSFNCMLLLNFENSLFDNQIHKYLKPTEKKNITRNFRKVGTKCVHKSKFMFGFVIISNLFVITIKSDRNMQFFYRFVACCLFVQVQMFATAATTPVHKHFVFNDILSKRFCSDFVLCVFFTVWLYFSFISHFCYYFFAIIFLGEKMGTLMNWKKKKKTE